MSELRISSEQVCFIIMKARTLDAEVPSLELEAGSNPSDDQMIGVLEDQENDPTEEELRGALEALNGAEMADLIALMWLGRGDGTIDDWSGLLHEVADADIEHPIEYLLGTPLLGDYLEEGLNQFGITCTSSGAPEGVELDET